MGTPPLRTEATDLLTRKLAEGFDTPDEAAEIVVEMLSDEHEPEEVERAVRELLPGVIAEREKAMRAWPPKTDCDRLDAAFEEMNANGIMARHDWTCCGTCGSAEMPDEYDRLKGRWAGVPIVGYTFYHQQGTESAAEGDGVYLGYGSTQKFETEPEYVNASLEVARRVCETLAKHGLKTEWDGSYDRRILVVVDWKRRARPRRFCGDKPDLEPSAPAGQLEAAAAGAQSWWTRFWRESR